MEQHQVVSPYEINFLDSFTWRSLCKEDLTEEEVSLKKKTDSIYSLPFIDNGFMYIPYHTEKSLC